MLILKKYLNFLTILTNCPFQPSLKINFEFPRPGKKNFQQITIIHQRERPKSQEVNNLLPPRDSTREGVAVIRKCNKSHQTSTLWATTSLSHFPIQRPSTKVPLSRFRSKLGRREAGEEEHRKA